MPGLAKCAALLILLACHAAYAAQGNAPTTPVTVVVVRHAESMGGLTPAGRRRAGLLAQTLGDLRFTNVFASHTARARETVEPVAAAQGLRVVQLPVPGSTLHGQKVTDDTARQEAIEPLAQAILKLPPGSVALVGANMDNIYGLLHRLGVPVAAPGRSCTRGSLCVPCLTKDCFPDQYDKVWFLVIEPGRARPLVMLESRYGAGWSP